MTPDMRTYRGKVYKVLAYLYNLYKGKGVVWRCVNEGSSRSGKTFDTFDFLYDICASSENGLNIYVFRATLQDCKEYTLADFKKKLTLRGVYNVDNIKAENIRPDYTIGKSCIHFRGLDKMDSKEGYDCDIVYINEALDGISKAQYENITMRVTTAIILDYNPKMTEHYVFRFEGQPDTYFTKTTYKDNPFCPKGVRRSIESYEPTPDNIAARTADEYRWKVYGLGERCAQEGLVYPNIRWIDAFPEHVEFYSYGIDFGFTHDPTAIAKVGVAGRNLYIQELFYAPVDDPQKLDTIIRQVAPELAQRGSGRIVAIADTADKYAKNPEGMVSALALRGLNVFKANKGAGSIITGITRVKEFDMHCVDTRNMKIEAGSYVWDSINGIPIGRPIDKFNHLWDAVRYVVQTLYSGYVIPDRIIES